MQEKRLEIGVLHGFRSIMVGLVVIFHIWQQSWLPHYFNLFGLTLNIDFLARTGFYFVDGMLLLSGFLLYLPYVQQEYVPITLDSTARFYKKRVARIIPSYVFSLLIILFFFILPFHRFVNGSQLIADILAHLTFTFTFSPQTYIHTALNGSLWTLAIEMQFYLFFPWILRLASKYRKQTLLSMFIVGFSYRIYVLLFVEQKAMFINQLPAFLDVYALGMLGAMAYCAIFYHVIPSLNQKNKNYFSLMALLVFVSCLYLINILMHYLANVGNAGPAAIHQAQLIWRFPLVLLLLLSMLSASFMFKRVQKILDNGFFRFLSTISLNVYIWHQYLTVEMRIAFMPENFRENINLQWAFTLLCYSVMLVVATMVTFGIEKPFSKLILRKEL